MTAPGDVSTDSSPATVGVIVNPHAGKDIRRLVSAAGHTSDVAKIGIVRRVVAGALEQGAHRVYVSDDSHRLSRRAIETLPGHDRVEVLDSPGTGSRLDTVNAAESMWKHGVGAVVCLGGDGTCRDVATGWPDAPLIAISTGTNNVYPVPIDGTSAGVAAAVVAGAHGSAHLSSVDVDALLTPSKRVVVHVDDRGRHACFEETALVEVALVETDFVGARAVGDSSVVRWVVACIAEPTTTGISSIAGRLAPVSRREAAGVLLRLGPGGRRVRVPLAPGTFETVEVAEVMPLSVGSSIELDGGGVLAFDGERTTRVSTDSTIRVSVDRCGPRVVDVAATLDLAARRGAFELPDDAAQRRRHPSQGKDPDAH